MKTLMAKWAVIAVMGASLVGCAGMSRQQQNTAAGAVIGGAAGHLIGGNTGSTLGGAALGGVIGSQIY